MHRITYSNVLRHSLTTAIKRWNRGGMNRKATRRNFISMPQGNEAVVVGGLMAANGAVYAAWQTQDPRFMMDNFSVSRAGISHHPHTLFTSMFSHKDGKHLFANMLTLFFFGPQVVRSLGTRTFLQLYVGSGIFASACHVVTAKYKRLPALGASGALNAIVAYSICVNPWALIVVFAELLPVPLPACLYGILFIGKDAAELVDIDIPLIGSAGRNIGHAAHLGGAFCGIGYFLFTRGRGAGGPWKRLK